VEEAILPEDDYEEDDKAADEGGDTQFLLSDELDEKELTESNAQAHAGLYDPLRPRDNTIESGFTPETGILELLQTILENTILLNIQDNRLLSLPLPFFLQNPLLFVGCLLFGLPIFLFSLLPFFLSPSFSPFSVSFVHIS
jgi:hypothetical protein